MADKTPKKSSEIKHGAVPQNRIVQGPDESRGARPANGARPATAVVKPATPPTSESGVSSSADGKR
jgi:hypothetical protein